MTVDPGWDELPILPRLRSGEQVGGYRIVRHLGEGELSDVYLARRPGDDRDVALKVLPAAWVAKLPDPERTRGIFHLVEVLEIGTCPLHAVGFVAMRMVHGHTLDATLLAFAAVRTRPSPEQRRLLVARFAEIAGALAVLHARGITHCDVKPANILIEGSDEPLDIDGAAVLVDLGIARESELLGAGSTLRFTPAYAAPEQRLGLRVGPRSDVFALGVVMHDLLLGQHPERRSRPTAEGLEALRTLDGAIDPDLSGIVAESTDPAVDRRYTDAGALARDLRCWLAGRRPGIRPRSPLRRLQRALQREPRAVFRRFAMLVASAIVVGALASLWAVQHTRGLRASALLREVEGGNLDAVALELGSRPGTELATIDAGSDVRTVIARLLTGQGDAARRHAAIVLSRDGCVRQPILARWLGRQLAHPAAEIRLESCRLLARALYDNPPRQAVSDLVPPGALLRILEERAGGFEALHALTALAALGDPAIGDAVLDTAIGLAADDPRRAEALRLTIEALHRLSTPPIDAVADTAWIQRAERLFDRAMGALSRQADRSALRARLATPVDSWLLTLRWMRGVAGLPARPWSEVVQPWPPPLSVRGIGRDPTLIADLVAGRIVPGQPGQEHDSAEIGHAVGCYGPSSEEAALVRAAVADALDRRGLDELDAAIARGRGWLSRSDLWQADPGSRLADELKATARRELVATTVGDTGHDGAVAACSLLTVPPTLAGSARKLWLEHGRLAFDESAPPVPFVWFGLPGRCQLELEFAVPAGARGSLTLHVQGQKGMRGTFPWSGEATLEVFVDDVLHGTLREFNTSERHSLPLPLSSVEVGRAHWIRLRLAASATTTCRIYELWID